ncbi:hypothetical protein [Pontibacillus halophilus]|uniref:hypothetical protein n=1 Tax=Pontibacillus halophilus TaxID=516704 RepID=UPI0003F4EFD7|nr:hypothetical protein [Pontibacillus halophilus]
MQEKKFTIWKNGKALYEGTPVQIVEWVGKEFKHSVVETVLLLDYTITPLGNIKMFLFGDHEDMYMYTFDQVDRMIKYGIEPYKNEQTHTAITRLLEICICPTQSDVGNSFTYHIYQAQLDYEDEQSYVEFCLSTVRKHSFIEDVKKGKISIHLGSMTEIFQTNDPNLAHALATEL